MQIAYSPEEARTIIANNRLAVILGVEVDSLGNWRRFEDLHLASRQDPAEARRLAAAFRRISATDEETPVVKVTED